MPEPEDKPLDAQGAPTATDDGHQEGIVDSQPEWKEALAELAKTNPAKAEALTKKLEGYDKVLTKRLTGLSQREREIVQLAETLKQAKPPPKSETPTSRVLDRLEQEASDAAQREGIRDLRKAIREESEEKLNELEAKWEKKFQTSQDHSIATARVGLAKEIKALEEVYGAPLIEKYKKDIEECSLRNPGAYSPDRWLHTVAEPDELRQALRIHLNKQIAKPNGDSAPEVKKPASAPVASTKPSNLSDQYKGKTPVAIRTGFNKALDDSVTAGLTKLGLKIR